jgi:Protein of unknown function (DUF3237)
MGDMADQTRLDGGPVGFDLDIPPIDSRLQPAEGLADVRFSSAADTATIELSYEMTFWERVEGPLGPTSGFPERVCWKIVEASLTGPRLRARLAMPGTDWIRVDRDGIRRQDQRAQFLTEGGALILMRYDTGIIQADQPYLAAISSGHPTNFGDQYMYMAPQFEVAGAEHGWLTRHLFVGRGRLAGANQIEYELYRLD